MKKMLIKLYAFDQETIIQSDGCLELLINYFHSVLSFAVHDTGKHNT